MTEQKFNGCWNCKYKEAYAVGMWLCKYGYEWRKDRKACGKWQLDWLLPDVEANPTTFTETTNTQENLQKMEFEGKMYEAAKFTSCSDCDLSDTCSYLDHGIDCPPNKMWKLKDAGSTTPECPAKNPEKESNSDQVTRPAHYNNHPSGVECIDIIKHYPACISAAMKYLWRQGLKDSEPAPKDIKKAIRHLLYQLEMEVEQDEILEFLADELEYRRGRK